MIRERIKLNGWNHSNNISYLDTIANADDGLAQEELEILNEIKEIWGGASAEYPTL